MSKQHFVKNETVQSRQSFYIHKKTRRQQSNHPLCVTRRLWLCVFAVVLCVLTPASFGLLLPTQAQNEQLTLDYVQIFTSLGYIMTVLLNHAQLNNINLFRFPFISQNGFNNLQVSI